jgi:hypothetical protein
MSYGFDDYAIRPTIYGPWASKAGRDRIMREYEAPEGSWGPVPVRLDRDGPEYAFRVGQPGVEYGETWKFGGWPSKAIRDALLERYRRNNPGAKIRIWSKRVPDVEGGGQVSADVRVV